MMLALHRGGVFFFGSECGVGGATLGGVGSCSGGGRGVR